MCTFYTAQHSGVKMTSSPRLQRVTLYSGVILQREKSILGKLTWAKEMQAADSGPGQGKERETRQGHAHRITSLYHHCATLANPFLYKQMVIKSTLEHNLYLLLTHN